MKILIRKSDNAVIYAQPDLILDTEAHGDGWRDPNFSTTNATIGDATLPALWSGAVWSYTNGVWAVLDAARYAEMLNVEKSTLTKQIDTDTDAVIFAVIGNRASEYERTETEATAYKAAGYTGTVPASVSAWATAKGWTATAATDDILAAAAGWRTAQASLRAARLLRKEQATTATSAAGLDAVKSNWSAFMAALKTSMGV